MRADEREKSGAGRGRKGQRGVHKGRTQWNRKKKVLGKANDHQGNENHMEKSERSRGKIF